MKHSFVMTYMLLIPYIIGYIILSFVVDIIGTYIILPSKRNTWDLQVDEGCCGTTGRWWWGHGSFCWGAELLADALEYKLELYIYIYTIYIYIYYFNYMFILYIYIAHMYVYIFILYYIILYYVMLCYIRLY